MKSDSLGKRGRDDADEGSQMIPNVMAALPTDAPSKKIAPAKKLVGDEYVECIYSILFDFHSFPPLPRAKKFRATLNQLLTAAKGSAVKVNDLVDALAKEKLDISAATVRAAVSKLAKDGVVLYDSKTEEIRRL